MKEVRSHAGEKIDNVGLSRILTLLLLIQALTFDMTSYTNNRTE